MGRDIRFQTDHVANKLALVALVVAHTSRPIKQLHASHPLVDGELVLASEVVDMLDETGHQLTEARVGVGAHRLDDIVGEIGVEAGGHFDSIQPGILDRRKM